MKLLALAEAPDHVCFRYRVAPFADALGELGWTLESLPLKPRTLPRSGQLRQARLADAVILQRKLLPFWQVALLRKYSRVLIYDFDDALFHRDSYAIKGPSSVARLAHFWATIYAADLVLAGNPYLAAQAGLYVDDSRVQTVPTCVAPTDYPLATHEARGGDVRLVWIGGHSTLPCLQHAAPMLSAAGRRLPGLSLRVISNRFLEIPDVRIEAVPWSRAGEAQSVAGSDIGISWLPDDPWSQGKCGLKVLQYMAAGLPVIANSVAMNRAMVIDGETGFLVDSIAGWVQAIETLAQHPELRHKMGLAGRRRVERYYNVSYWAPRFAWLIHRAWCHAVGQPCVESKAAAWPRVDPWARAACEA